MTESSYAKLLLMNKTCEQCQFFEENIRADLDEDGQIFSFNFYLDGKCTKLKTRRLLKDPICINYHERK